MQTMNDQMVCVKESWSRTYGVLGASLRFVPEGGIEVQA